MLDPLKIQFNFNVLHSANVSVRMCVFFFHPLNACGCHHSDSVSSCWLLYIQKSFTSVLCIHISTHIIIAMKHAIPPRMLRNICPTEQILLLYCRMCHKIRLERERERARVKKKTNQWTKAIHFDVWINAKSQKRSMRQ